nr:MAG TPA: DNA repair protein MmcB-like protein [Caudoviricetes sp.]DAT55408.1 MAG TPA: DNA repair protein MmcB-like protein [Caudoviricetes sp.]
MGIKRKQTPLLTKEQVTEQLLQQHLRGWKSNPKYIVENLYVFDWESDMLIKTRSGYWYEVECKISLADFKNDFKRKWRKHDLLKTGDEKHRRPNYFYYCVPWYLSGKVLPLLPSYAGLIVLTENGKLNEVRRASLLHTDKYTDEDLKLCNKFYYAYRNWKERVENHQPTEGIKRLKDEIAFLKAEYKAVAGCDIQDVL